ncbi:heterokaryon incompatibility protein-domain-containing protein [Suillus ampliporus]|nr:heterokaryon incompatibility protein-domain-containing protein [Suillus ampliporus]
MDQQNQHSAERRWDTLIDQFATLLPRAINGISRDCLYWSSSIPFALRQQISNIRLADEPSMRLLHTKKLTLETPGADVPYAILSHRWLEDSEEVSFQDLQYKPVSPSGGSHDNHNHAPTFPSNVLAKKGFKKLQGACEQAYRGGLEYIWIDTCCIDKTNSTELSEAINSMHAWYQDSAVCYVYLHDIDNEAVKTDIKTALENASWFYRGWTLQELIAPHNVLFFTKDWSKIGTKATLASTLHEITHIRQEVLLGRSYTSSIAEKMSWAAGRQTQRIEDRAYSLMGLFGIHMPIIYGEGEKAFRRLQLEIMKSSDDQTIFAWRGSLAYPIIVRSCGLLAPAPDVFSCTSPYPIVSMDHTRFNNLLHTPGNPTPLRDSLRRGYSISNDGIHITLPMKQGEGDAWLAVLRCGSEGQEVPYGIYLKQKAGSDEFLRTSPTKLPKLKSEDLKGLTLRKICIVVDHHIPPTIHRRQFFTFQSADLVWDRCGYYICPDPGGNHDVCQGVGYHPLDCNARIEISNDVQCGCIYWQTDNEVRALLIGIEHHRPWVHVLAYTDLRRYIDTSQSRRQTAPLFTSPPTSAQSDNQAGPISPLMLSHRSLSPPPAFRGPNNRKLPWRQSTAPVAVPERRRGGTGCPVCSIIRNHTINISTIKNSRVDLVTETAAHKQIEVGIRKGQAHASEVEYVITVAVSVV